MKMKKSIFSKIFSLNIIVLIVGMLILAVTQYALLTQYIYRERIDTLRDNSSVIAGFINSGASLEHIDNFLYGFSRSTNRSILIIDKNCKIIMASADAKFFNESAKYIDEKYCQTVLEKKENTVVGTLGDVYKMDMFTLQVPVLNGVNKETIGAIFISAPAPEMQDMKLRILKITGVSILLVTFISLLFSFAVSRKISKPIKKIGSVAKKFAKGDFSSRVEMKGNGYNITEISELAETFNNMAHDIEMADNIRNNFVSDVSHELRTPMTTIGGFVDGILDDTIPQDRQKEYLKIVKEEIVRLSGLVNSFLDITRLKNEKLSLEMADFDINETIRRTLINLESRINDKNIDIDIEFESESCIVKADQNSIKRVLTNLLDNAIKFTNENGVITIKVYSKQHEVFVSVKNTGCGIAEAEQKLIFERFYKVDRSRAINRQGTGIGLYIVKDILNQHGKDIKVNSCEGEYAEFVFSLTKAKH